jgi:hypothetical protein
MTQNLRTFRFALIVATLLLALSSLGLTQNTATSTSISVPHLIKFSGILKDEAGAPKRGVVGITFTLYKDQQGGTPLWLETQNAQADANGHYTVMLGATKSEGLPVEFFTSNEARWVGVQPQGQNEQPRVLLVSAPYALKASDAETLGGKPASAFVLSKPGSGSTAATGKTGTSDTSVNNPNVSPTLGGSGTPNHITKWKTKTTLENSGIIENSAGKVGIGAAPGNFQFQVTAPAQLGALFQGPASGVGAGLDLQTTGTGGKGWEILATGNTSAQGAGKLNIRDLSTGADVFTIDGKTNRVGIGTVNPGAPLDVEANNAAAVVLGLNSSTGSFSAGVRGESTATSTSNIGVEGDTSSTGALSAGVEGRAQALSGLTYGVEGLTFSSSNGAAGVFGDAFANSGQTFGVQGQNSSVTDGAVGVLGQEFGFSGKTFGSFFLDNSPNGTATYSQAITESATAIAILGLQPVGVWGDTGSSAGGAAGLVGTADDARAIYLQNNSPSGVPTAFMFNSADGQKALQAGGSGGFCTVDTTGHLQCDHALSVLAPVDSGQRRVALYAVQSPQNWFEDFGSGHLASGTASVSLDRTFAQTVDTASDYHVYLTPEGDCRGLYVSHKTATGFEVHELGGGQSNAPFAYRIVAQRLGFENVRMEDMTEQWKKMNAPLPKVAPGQRLTLPARPAPLALVKSNLVSSRANS